MPPDLAGLLRRLADEYEAEEKGELSRAERERLDALEARVAETYSRDEILKALGTLTPEEKRTILGELDVDPPVNPPEEQPKRERKPKVEDDDQTKRPTREGRKSGKLYMWDVDEEGRKFSLDIPHLYSGEDEPDEVELPDENAA